MIITRRMMMRALNGAFLACMLSALCVAQQSKPDKRHETPANVSAQPAATTDGAVNPEQIPDSIAFALFLDAASEQPNSKIDEKARQRAFLTAAGGLSEQELAAAATILSQFQIQVTVLRSSAQPTTNQGLADHESLVTATMNALATSLSQATMTRLYQFIQSEKRKMKITSPAM